MSIIRFWILVLILPNSLIAAAKNEKQKSPPKKYTIKMAREVVSKAESLRAFEQAKSKVEVRTQEGAKKTDYLMDVLQSSGKRAYLEFTAPAEEVGRRMLAIKTSYWSKFPDSKRVVVISRREAIGNSAFAIADVFQMDVIADYKPKIIGEVKCLKTTCYQLQLDAVHDEAPYHKILYLVRKSDSFPVKAEFYGQSGKHLKTMKVQKTRKIAGRVRPYLLEMEDKVTEGKVSWWRTINVKEERVPDAVFSKSYLKSR